MDIAHDVKGSGDPVALVSGLAQVGARWRRVTELLAGDFTVVTFDNRECGATGACPDGFTLADCAGDVLTAGERVVDGPAVRDLRTGGEEERAVSGPGEGGEVVPAVLPGDA